MENKKNIKVAAVVVLYYPDNNLLQNLQSYVNFVDMLILVDNTDENKLNKELIADIKVAFKDKVTYISLKGNFGIARALNVGFIEGNKLGMTHILTMDQDSHFENDIISVYKEYLALYGDSPVILSPYYDFERNKKIKNIRKLGKNSKYEEYIEKKYVMQSANLISIKDFYIFGKFNEDLFIDCVDYEYCLRARKKGGKVISCLNAKLGHQPAIAKEKTIFGMKILYGSASPLRYYYQIRNLLWTFFVYKEIGMLKWALIKFVKIILLFDNKKIYLKFGFKGINDAIFSKLGKREFEI